MPDLLLDGSALRGQLTEPGELEPPARVVGALVLGGLERAQAFAKQRAKLSPDSEVELVVYPGKKSFYDFVKDPFGASERMMGLGRLRGIKDPRPLQTLAAPLRVFRRGEPLAVMPNVFLR